MKNVFGKVRLSLTRGERKSQINDYNDVTARLAQTVRAFLCCDSIGLAARGRRGLQRLARTLLYCGIKREL
jgi:hypothetical protein